MNVFLYTLENISKIFGYVTALDRINLNIPERCFLAVLGPNGSGKSTLLKLLAFIIKPNQGSIMVKDDLNVKRESFGYVSHQLLLYHDLTVRQNLTFFASMYQVKSADKNIGEALDVFRLMALADRTVRDLSRGQQQRVSIARAIIHKPKILIMDEPFTGLDDEQTYILDHQLKNLHESGINIIFSSHNRNHAMTLSNCLCELNNGKIDQFISSLPA